MIRIATTVLLISGGARAYAYSDPSRYAQQAELGGGGGRHFTGSPQDGFTCAVCHRGGDAPVLEIRGLPAFFKPGSRYDVEARWTAEADATASIALQLELITADGSHPDVAIAPLEELPATQRCDQQADGNAAVYATNVGRRRVIGVEDCGASAVGFSFTAPDASELVFALAAVRSDRSGTTEGDGVFDMRTTLRDQIPSSGCAAGGDAQAGSAFAIAALVARRRRRRSLGLDGKHTGQLERPYGLEAYERKVVKSTERGAHTDDERGVAVSKLKPMRELASELVGIKRRQLAIAGRVAVAQRQISVAFAIEPRVALGVVAVAQGQRGEIRNSPSRVGSHRVRTQPPVVEIEPVFKAGRNGATKRVTGACVDGMANASIGNVLGYAERRAGCTHRVVSDGDEPVWTCLIAVEECRFPCQLGDGRAAEHLRHRGARADAVQRLAKEWVARSPYRVEAAEQIESQCGVPTRDVELSAEHQSVRPVVGLKRIAISTHQTKIATLVPNSSGRFVAEFANGRSCRCDDIDRGTGPRIDRVASLRADIARLAFDCDRGRQHPRRIAIGAPVHGGSDTRQPMRTSCAVGDCDQTKRCDYRFAPLHVRILSFASSLSMITALVVSSATGCFQPRSNDDESGDAATRPTELFQPQGETVPPPICPDDPSPLTAMQIHVRTSSAGGRFAPRNVGAIWIERSDGTFVKTVARWGTVRAKWLKRFVAASAGSVVDAVTGPTLLSHQTHDVRWSLTGPDRCEVPSGDYRVVFELTDRNGMGPALEVPFAKGVTPRTTMPLDDTYFHDVVLNVE